MRALLPLLLLATACFDPTYPSGLMCSSTNGCPPGQQCNRDTMMCFDPVAPDAAPFDAQEPDAMIDAAPQSLAPHLGDLCARPSTPDGPTVCTPLGLRCAFVGAETSGFCTFACATPDQPGVCGAGYTKVGSPVCSTAVLPPDPFCAIRCGVEHGLPETCPAGLTCRDSNANSMTDRCLPPL